MELHESKIPKLPLKRQDGMKEQESVVEQDSFRTVTDDFDSNVMTPKPLADTPEICNISVEVSPSKKETI